MDMTVTLPALGEAIDSATISAWLKAVGDRVEMGEPLVEVSTDKVDTELESPASGVVTEIRVDEDSIVDVGAVLAIIRQGAVETNEPQSALEPEVPSPPRSQPEADSERQVAQPSSAADGAADRPADDAGASVRGTTQNLSRLRKVIAHRMVESLQTSAQLTTIVEVDVTEVGRVRRRHNAELVPGEGTKLSYLPFIAVAALEALRTYPQVNSTIDLAAGTISYPDAEHLGVAVDTDKGLFVPVIRDAGSLSVTDLAMRIADVAERTRTSSIGVDELTGGTFTITNTGSRGALMDTPIINQPQVAILGAGVVARRPVVTGREGEDEGIAIRSMVFLSLTYDHRVVDGADAARYLTAVKERLEQGSFDLAQRNGRR